MEVPSDNSPETSSKGSLSHTGDGIVVDIGTGDGRFVSVSAKQNPNKFFIGIDANTKSLEKPSMKATRKPVKGGLPNALFVQAAVEDLPNELNGVADEIHIHFPWGSLLKAAVNGEMNVLLSFRRVAAIGCLLEIIIGIDAERDRSEVERLSLVDLSDERARRELIQRYRQAGFEPIRNGELSRDEWSQIETSWAKKLSGNDRRRVRYFLFQAV